MSYRNDHEALFAYHDNLIRELAAVEGQLGELDDLAATRARLTSELARVRSDLAARAARLAPVQLAKVSVARPCKESWDGMTGDDRVRHCKRCDKPVFNLSEMTAGEAEAVLTQHGTTPCVRFYRRADGTVKTADCDGGRRWGVAAAGALAAGALAASAAAAMHAPTPRKLPVVTDDPWSHRGVTPPYVAHVPAPPPPVPTMGVPPPPEGWIGGEMMEEPPPQPPPTMGRIAIRRMPTR